jgi:hypothetical protein
VFLREEQTSRLKQVLKRIFGPRRKEVRGSLRKFLDEELPNFMFFTKYYD